MIGRGHQNLVGGGTCPQPPSVHGPGTNDLPCLGICLEFDYDDTSLISNLLTFLFDLLFSLTMSLAFSLNIVLPYFVVAYCHILIKNH